jgi:hypothetical protein
MQFEDHPAPPPPAPRGPSLRVWLAATAVALLVATAVAAFLMTRGEGEAVGSPPPSLEPTSPQTTASSTTTTIDTETEVVARLREILRVRDNALLQRNAGLLDDIYTVDCNCLKDGRIAIRQLRQKKNGLEGAINKIGRSTS